ncbi:DnaJ domain-containing protein [Candidatus Micrarchaeota archaeon]|nr:DnaJ domain-containing protein [Candidatus Micrarchaeota archaeon]
MERRIAFKILGVPEDSNAKGIKSAYRRMARQFHPDRYATVDAPTRTALESTMKELTEAYRVLTDAETLKTPSAVPSFGSFLTGKRREIVPVVKTYTEKRGVARNPIVQEPLPPVRIELELEDMCKIEERRVRKEGRLYLRYLQTLRSDRSLSKGKDLVAAADRIVAINAPDDRKKAVMAAYFDSPNNAGIDEMHGAIERVCETGKIDGPEKFELIVRALSYFYLTTPEDFEMIYRILSKLEEQLIAQMDHLGRFLSRNSVILIGGEAVRKGIEITLRYTENLQKLNQSGKDIARNIDIANPLPTYEASLKILFGTPEEKTIMQIVLRLRELTTIKSDMTELTRRVSEYTGNLHDLQWLVGELKPRYPFRECADLDAYEAIERICKTAEELGIGIKSAKKATILVGKLQDRCKPAEEADMAVTLMRRVKETGVVTEGLETFGEFITQKSMREWDQGLIEAHRNIRRRKDIELNFGIIINRSFELGQQPSRAADQL